MSAATVKLKVIPRRIVKKSEAACYCCMPVKRFAAEFPYPSVVMPGSDAELIDLQDCDRWIDILKAGGTNDGDSDTIIEKLGK
jgi:hypothetical protein